MEERNFTDEEIVNALEDMASECETNFSASVVDLIHRLQDENAGLKQRGESVINSLHETIDKKQAEIERLTEENGQLKGYNSGLEYENAELQKQVDELNKKLIAMESVFHNLVIVEKDKSVKATAKEIFILAEDYNCGYESDIDNFMKELKERYGVEVE